MRTRIGTAVLVAALAAPSTAAAQTGDAVIIQQLVENGAQLYKIYENTVAFLREARETKETAQDLYELRNAEAEHVVSYALGDKVARVYRDLHTLEQRWPELTREQRIERVLDGFERRYPNASRETRQRMAKRVGEISRLEDLRAAKMQESADMAAGRNVTDKTLQASQASSLALMAAETLHDQQQRQERRVQRERQEEAALDYTRQFRALLEETKDIREDGGR